MNLIWFAQFGVRLQDQEYDVLLPRAREIFNPQRFPEFHKRGSRTGLKLRQVHDILARLELLRRNYLKRSLVIRIFVLWWTTATATVRIALTLVGGTIGAGVLWCV